MFGIAGTKADPVLVNFAARCLMRDVPFAVLDLLEIADRGSWDISVPPQENNWVNGSEMVRLEDLTGVYVRPIFLSAGVSEHHRWYALMDGFGAWMDETDVNVVNRPTSHSLNSYKPAHYAWLAERGMTVPDSVVSCDSSVIADFLAAGPAVVKPLCGTRATTRMLDFSSLPRLALSEGPVLTQRFVKGYDVRVHVIGERVISCHFASDAVDYRSDRTAARTIIDIPEPLRCKLIELTAVQGLTFAGWDFKVDAQGRYWCLECNPMPGYSFYDRICGGAISDALIDELSAPRSATPD